MHFCTLALVQLRRLFKTPNVTPASEIDLQWEKPDEEGLVAYMCGKRGFKVIITCEHMCILWYAGNSYKSVILAQYEAL